MIATSLSVNAITTQLQELLPQSSISITQLSQEDQQAQKLQKEREDKASKIDTYFENHNMPLAGYGMEMVLAAERHDIDWRMIPAIAVRESTGGRNACKSVSFSPFGFGSCRISFKSYEDAIEVVAKNLGGDNPNTARHYDGKTDRGILQSYNPPSVIPRYADQVLAIMDKIGNVEI